MNIRLWVAENVSITRTLATTRELIWLRVRALSLREYNLGVCIAPRAQFPIVVWAEFEGIEMDVSIDTAVVARDGGMSCFGRGFCAGVSSRRAVDRDFAEDEYFGFFIGVVGVGRHCVLQQ